MFLANEAGLSAKDEGFAIKFEQSVSVVITKLKMMAEQVNELGDEEWDFDVQPWRKFDEFLSPALLRTAFLQDRLDVDEALKRIISLYDANPEIALENTSHSFYSLDRDDEEDTAIDNQLTQTRQPTRKISDLDLQAYDFIAFDLETTGLHPVWSKIIEIGAVRFRLDGTEIGRFEQLVDPGSPIPPEATIVNGISDAMVSDKPAIESVLSKFIQFAQGEKIIFLAHNASFDQGFLERAFRVQGLTPPSGAIIDTLAIAKRTIPNARNHRLPTLCAELGINLPVAHRAMHDAEATRNIFCEMIRRADWRRDVANISTEATKGFNNSTEAEIDLPERFHGIQKAIEEHRTIRITYGSFRQTMLQITPNYVFADSGKLYLSASCKSEGKIMTFRLDRLISYEIE